MTQAIIPDVLVELLNTERMVLRAAAFRASRLYPGVVGELVSNELLSWEEFGYRTSPSGLVARLLDDLSKTPLPGCVAPSAAGL